jgi:hypothetical protein
MEERLEPRDVPLPAEFLRHLPSSELQSVVVPRVAQGSFER